MKEMAGPPALGQFNWVFCFTEMFARQVRPADMRHHDKFNQTGQGNIYLG